MFIHIYICVMYLFNISVKYYSHTCRYVFTQNLPLFHMHKHTYIHTHTHTQYIYIYIYIYTRTRCLWCNDYCHLKWTR